MPKPRMTSTFAAAIGIAAASLLGGPTASAAPAAGTVLSLAPLPPVATLPGSVGSTRILYGSTTANDRSTTTSAAVYFPPGEPPAGGWPVIAWAHGTVGLADKCANSIGGPALPDRDWAYLGAWLRQGYAIVAADYAGLGTSGEHPYLNGVTTAHNVVDAVRAATREFPSLSKKWVVVGQSQGAGAAVFTARYATEFGGPELDYRGGVATGIPAYVEDGMAPLGPHLPPVELPPHTTAYLLYILNGLRVTYPDLSIESFLTDAGRTWLARAQQDCIEPFGDEIAAQHIVFGDLLARPLSDIPDVHNFLHRYLGLPESGYDRPLFLGQGLLDTDVIMPETLRYAAVLEANGEPVTFHTYPQDHSGTVNASLPDSIPFVRNLFG
ncbi:MULTISPECIES: lipase family protein [unclassified Nocardia]|uniref:lipase family protein n=1 Tax=unclassified Nocardia TaxID=2637762 RepID=UPI001CE45A86|nr:MULTISPECIES: lipase family protein [unclassified Nocardia]